VGLRNLKRKRCPELRGGPLVSLCGDVGRGYGCGTDSLWEVGQKPNGVSPYGVQDMGGNALEWTHSWYSGDRVYRVMRGGGAYQGPSYYFQSRYRQSFAPGSQYDDFGFRCVKRERKAELAEACVEDIDCTSGQCSVGGICAPADMPEAMTYVPGGDFIYGPNGSTETLTTDEYYLDIYEVTAGDYKACVDSGSCSYSGGSSTYYTYNNSKDNHPINYVNWQGAVGYCNWKGKR